MDKQTNQEYNASAGESGLADRKYKMKASDIKYHVI